MSCASGFDHALFLDHLGCVWSCGDNYYGQQGTGDFSHLAYRNKPEKNIRLKVPITSVSAGGSFSFFLDEEGSVWTCGVNRYRERSQANCNIVPVKIANIPKMQGIFAHFECAFFLDVEGSVWSLGENSHGQLGLGHEKETYKAEKIDGLPQIVSISGGDRHSIFLDCEGSVWGCGDNEYGELGLGIPQGTMKESKPKKISKLPKIIAISAGNDFSLFLDEEENVWVCGSNGDGELGLGQPICEVTTPQRNNLTGIVSISAGNRCSMFLNSQGDLFTCGSNIFSQLGLGDRKEKIFYIRTPHKVDNLPPISLLSQSNAASDYLQVVDWEGSVWGCGTNGYGQLGLGDEIGRCVFEKIEGLPSLKLPMTAKQTKSARNC